MSTSISADAGLTSAGRESRRYLGTVMLTAEHEMTVGEALAILLEDQDRDAPALAAARVELLRLPDTELIERALSARVQAIVPPDGGFLGFETQTCVAARLTENIAEHQGLQAGAEVTLAMARRGPRP